MKIAILLLAALSFLFSQNLKDKLTDVSDIQKGELTIKKSEDKYEGKFTLAVKKEKKDEVLELLAIDFSGKEQKTIVLYDNGQHGDEIAGDGIYSGTTFIMPGSKRRYFIKSNEGKYDTQVLFEYILFSW